MRILRICTCAAFAVILAVFLFFYIREERNTDATWPVITIEEQLIDVSLRPTDEELMKGITAYDGKDGDITEKLVVESIYRARYQYGYLCGLRQRSARFRGRKENTIYRVYIPAVLYESFAGLFGCGAAGYRKRAGGKGLY